MHVTVLSCKPTKPLISSGRMLFTIARVQTKHRAAAFSLLGTTELQTNCQRKLDWHQF